MKGKIRNWMLRSYVALGTKTLGKGGIKYPIDKVALISVGEKEVGGQQGGMWDDAKEEEREAGRGRERQRKEWEEGKE